MNFLVKGLKRNQSSNQRITVYLPGRIVLIKDLTHSNYQAKWAKYEDFDRVELSSRMVADHMPNNVAKILRKVENFSIDF